MPPRVKLTLEKALGLSYTESLNDSTPLLTRKPAFQLTPSAQYGAQLGQCKSPSCQEPCYFYDRVPFRYDVNGSQLPLMYMVGLSAEIVRCSDDLTKHGQVGAIPSSYMLALQCTGSGTGPKYRLPTVSEGYKRRLERSLPLHQNALRSCPPSPCSPCFVRLRPVALLRSS